MMDGDRIIDWLGSEAAAQRDTMRNQCLLAVILASGFAVLVVFLGRGQAAVPALALAGLFLSLFIGLSRRRVEEGARTLLDSLRHRPQEIRRIAHVVYGRNVFRTNAVVIESERDGYLFVKTRHWDVVLNGLAARCPHARVELCGPRPGRRP
jgi:hypothetical protein